MESDQIGTIAMDLTYVKQDISRFQSLISELQLQQNFHKHNGYDSSQRLENLFLYGGIQTVTSAYTITPFDYTVLVDATSAGVTVTLPPASSLKGYVFNVKKIDSSGNSVTIDADSSETIDGSATKATSTQYANFCIQSDGTAWYVI